VGGRKRFFFEKKNQKTFAQLASAFPQRLSLNVSKFLPLSCRLPCVEAISIPEQLPLFS
jgi:hypothetical protein